MQLTSIHLVTSIKYNLLSNKKQQALCLLFFIFQAKISRIHYGNYNKLQHQDEEAPKSATRDISDSAYRNIRQLPQEGTGKYW